MSVYTNVEKVQIIKWSYSGNSTRQIRNLFEICFENRPIPNRSTITRILNNFEKNCCANSDHILKHKQVLCVKENDAIDLLARIEAGPKSSVRKIASECRLSKTRVHEILKCFKYKPYKGQDHQELLYQDPVSRATFCEIMTEKCNQENNFSRFILFTDECTFHLVADHNKQIHRYWSKENPHIVINSRTQYPQKVNVWAGILKNKIVGPIFIDGNLNSATYLNLLQNEIADKLGDIAGDDEIWFHHDGCPAHNATEVKNYLHLTFPNKWIGRGGEILWPPRSPDLNPCDYFLWPFLKNQLYNFEEIESIESLKEKITNI